jgi:drug/metabolite transporter (DMT)-like permease
MFLSSIVLLSEAALALYPILIKTVPTNLPTQLLSRLITYSILGFVFASPSDIQQTWGNLPGILRSFGLGAITLVHIASSYFAFDSLPTGISMSLFYTYPIFNILGAALFFQESFGLQEIALVFLAFIGAILLSFAHKNSVESTNESMNWSSTGIFAGILAALTESAMYFAVRTAKQPDPFFAVLELYPAALPLLLGALFFMKSPIDLRLSSWTPMILFNTLVGFVGYCLRFYAIPRLSTVVFSLLSFVGVIASFVWGYLFVDEVPSTLSVLGGSLIAAAAAFVKSQ